MSGKKSNNNAPQLNNELIKEAYIDLYGALPLCANDGCDNPVIVRDWKYLSFKHVCSNCDALLKKRLPPRKGVTFYKKDYCENQDGRLGFKCPIDPDFIKGRPYLLHGDHIDGNHHHNISHNLQTICVACHTVKGMTSGDFDSAKKGREVQKVMEHAMTLLMARHK